MNASSRSASTDPAGPCRTLSSEPAHCAPSAGRPALGRADRVPAGYGSFVKETDRLQRAGWRHTVAPELTRSF